MRFPKRARLIAARMRRERKSKKRLLLSVVDEEIKDLNNCMVENCFAISRLSGVGFQILFFSDVLMVTRSTPWGRNQD